MLNRILRLERDSARDEGTITMGRIVINRKTYGDRKYRYSYLIRRYGNLGYPISI